MTITGIICGPRVYNYKGVLFEVRAYSGPWPLKRRGHSPKKAAGKGFYRLYDEFDALSEEEQEKCRIGGGCVAFGTKGDGE